VLADTAGRSDGRTDRRLSTGSDCKKNQYDDDDEEDDDDDVDVDQTTN
jgi:hypothetical protein